MVDVGTGLLAIGAATAIAGGCVGTGIAQSSIGAAGVGAVAEKQEVAGNVLLFLVIPETIVIFAFVIAILLIMGFGAIGGGR